VCEREREREREGEGRKGGERDRDEANQLFTDKGADKWTIVEGKGNVEFWLSGKCAQLQLFLLDTLQAKSFLGLPGSVINIISFEICCLTFTVGCGHWLEKVV
jgi:hypothetical protein